MKKQKLPCESICFNQEFIENTLEKIIRTINHVEISQHKRETKLKEIIKNQKIMAEKQDEQIYKYRKEMNEKFEEINKIKQELEIISKEKNII